MPARLHGGGHSLSNKPPESTLDDLEEQAWHQERQLIEALRDGSEDAFVSLVNRYHSSMVGVASRYVSSRSVAEEVVQETWLGVLKGLGKFEGRSSLKTWIFRILANLAKTRMHREGRSVPFSALDPDAGGTEPSVDPTRFLDADHPQWPYHWRTPPQSWGESPEERLLSQEAQEYIRREIDRLPPAQRSVITLRDIEGYRAEEVCETLTITGANQRVLLHRARSRVRHALEQYFNESAGARTDSATGCNERVAGETTLLLQNPPRRSRRPENAPREPVGGELGGGG